MLIIILRFRILFLLLLAVLLPACSLFERNIEAESPPPLKVENHVETHRFTLDDKNSVIGSLASVSLEQGDTLLDLARHFGLGYQHMVEANPQLDPWVPEEGSRAILPLQFILPNAQRSGVVVNLAAMRLFYFTGGKHPTLSTWPVGIGREGRSTPLGAMAVLRKMQHPTWYVPDSIRKTHEQQGDPLPSVVPPGPDNPLGDFALYLSKPSYLIHGTNKPYSIGIRASNGCIRLRPEDIEQAFSEISPGTPVKVVNQPYLRGWLDGELYLEAHRPFEEVDAGREKKNLMAELQRISKKQQRKMDWPKIEEILKDSRGIPTPIFEKSETLNMRLADATRLEHPARLAGQQDNLPPPLYGWLVRTAAIEDEYSARKLAAQLNHLGPRIPARAVAGNQGYQVEAGPFIDEKEAKKVQLTLVNDFNSKNEIIGPPKVP